MQAVDVHPFLSRGIETECDMWMVTDCLSRLETGNNAELSRHHLDSVSVWNAVD